jgi:general secretion pathway protein A
MYNSFFSLGESPFNVNVDPRFFFPTRQTEVALQRIAYGIQNRQGLVLLTGEVGTGKTMMIHQLLDWLRQLQTPTAFVFNSNLGEGDLFNLMACDFGIATDPGDKTNLPIRLNRWLLECHQAGVSPVLIVDEAQGLSFARLEEIRLLLNIETPSEKLLQVVFAGQPELEVNLNQFEGRQLRQRIAVRCKINPLTLEQTHGYIEQRLRIAGAHGEPIFERQAMDAVYFYARGIPRVINLICEHSLINAYVDQMRPVQARIVEEVASEFQLTISHAAPAPATIQSTFGWAQTHPSAKHEPAPTQRAHAAVAGVSSPFPSASLNSPRASASPAPQARLAAPSIQETSPVLNDINTPAIASVPTEQRGQSPLILPALIRPASHISAAVVTAASSPVAPTAPSREAKQSGAEIRSAEQFTHRRRWMPRHRAGRTFRRWWSAWQNRFLSIVNTSTRWMLTLSVVRWLKSPRRPELQRPAKRPLQKMHHEPAPVPLHLHRDWFGWLDKYADNIVQSTRHQRTALLRWLQQPLTTAHRR